MSVVECNSFTEAAEQCYISQSKIFNKLKQSKIRC
ncbi:MAG: LysR family transcriptional regulator [Thomasclavelia ramosa]